MKEVMAVLRMMLVMMVVRLKSLSLSFYSKSGLYYSTSFQTSLCLACATVHHVFQTMLCWCVKHLSHTLDG